MNQRLLIRAAVLAALCAVPLGLAAQTASAPPEKDPDAMAALQEMGAYLRTLKAFQVVAKQERDDVLVDGQKVENDNTAELLVRMPNGLYMTSTSDRKSRIYFYDGKTFTVYLPRMNMYASAAAPPTIGQLDDALEAKYGIELPLRDLFVWGTDAAKTAPSRRPETSAPRRWKERRASTMRSARKASTGRSGFSSATIRCRAR